MAETAGLIDPGMTAEAALTALVTGCALDIDRHLAQVMETAAPEGPHKTRVALRRLTTALDAFAPLLRRSAARALRREAKRIFRRLGEVRDVDVYLETLTARDRDRLAPEAETLREATRTALRERGPWPSRRVWNGRWPGLTCSAAAGPAWLRAVSRFRTWRGRRWTRRTSVAAPMAKA